MSDNIEPASQQQPVSQHHAFLFSHILNRNEPTPNSPNAVYVGPTSGNTQITENETAFMTPQQPPAPPGPPGPSGSSFPSSSTASPATSSNTQATSATPTASSQTPSENTFPAGRILTDNVVDLLPPPPAGDGGNTRVRLSEQDKTLLIRTCCEYGDLYLAKSKEDFWITVQTVMSHKLGKRIGNPRQTVSRMVKEFEAGVAYEKTTSGKPIFESDLKQALWIWKCEWIDREAHERSLSEEAQQARAKDKELAIAQRKAMLQTLTDKPSFQSAKAAIDEGKRPNSASTKQEKIEELKAKRRRIRDREENFEELLENDNRKMTETLTTIARVADAVMASITAGNSPVAPDNTGSTLLPTAHLEAQQLRVERIEQQVEVLQQESADTAARTREILLILERMQANTFFTFPPT
ncbi:hypothetical protein BJ508DRAFT_321555 [Ascobolus immersus RN42]|uniref:Uncharacterized protein n=1 Tax=Ascobolus immersus RN42 TaxID=1160509 RepID=A0A3N4IXM8_ASCIM|nr:hypothetical protein BJ508DRAFT_321555 [Ascobolus immersus RN42]